MTIWTCRKNGSSGGHNGIKSIISNLGTDAFPRFRLGIGHPVHEQQAVISHVLQPFAGDDKQLIEEAVKKMADALELWLKEDGDNGGRSGTVAERRRRLKQSDAAVQYQAGQSKEAGGQGSRRKSCCRTRSN